MRLYIDPGTGSMLFAILIGALGVLRFAFKGVYVRLKFLLSGGQKVETDRDAVPLVIFSDDKRYWQVFEPVCRELDARGFDTVYMTASSDDPALTAEYPHLHAEFIGTGNKPYARLNFLNAAMLLSTTPGLDVYQWKRSKDVKWYIHMLHSMEVITYNSFGVDFYDALLLSSQHQVDEIRALEKLRNEAEKEIRIVGVPYWDDMKARLHPATSADTPCPTVLLAPSWGRESIFNRFGARVIQRLLETGYRIIVRPHPQSFTSEKDMLEGIMREYPESERLEWNRDANNLDVLSRSDILISDFSGVIFDFAILHDKPVICAAADWDPAPYDIWWLDIPMWTQAVVPRIGPILTEENLPQLKRLIDDCLASDVYRAGRQSLREEAWTHRGNGAKNVADYLVEKYAQLTQPEDERCEQG